MVGRSASGGFREFLAMCCAFIEVRECCPYLGGRHAERACGRAGFSLLEMLLVLSLLVAVTALAYPALSGPLESNRLRQSGDLVRASWVRARTKAMEKGRTYAFRYTPGTGNYTVEPWLTADDYLESDELVSMGVTAGGQSIAAASVPRVKTLPENITFVASETTLDMRAEMLGLANPDQAATVQMMPPIFFYPDGSTSTARLVVVNSRGRCVTVTMRGLTGMVKVSEVQTQAEALQAYEG
jgi:prepilin-type N-terminal cleavage/methylation domain-containing protein